MQLLTLTGVFVRQTMAVAVIASLLIGPGVAAAKPPPISDFVSQIMLLQPTVSPDGRLVGLVANNASGSVLATFERDAFAEYGKINLGNYSLISEYVWAGSDRIVMYGAFRDKEDLGWKNYGELFAANADGGNGWQIFGATLPSAYVGSRIKRAEPMAAWAEVLDGVPGDPRNITIAAYPYVRGGSGSMATTYLLDVNSGARRRISRVPVADAEVHVDEAGAPRCVRAVTDDSQMVLYYRSPIGDAWQLFRTTDATRDRSRVVLCNSQGEIVLLDPEFGLLRLVIGTGEPEVLYHDPARQIVTTYLTADGKDVAALGYDRPTPGHILLIPGDPISRALNAAQDALPGQRIRMPSRSQDGKFAIVEASGSNRPGDYYVFDVDGRRLEFFASAMAKLDPESLATGRFITYEGFGGIRLEGLLTLPKGSNGNRVPLVVDVGESFDPGFRPDFRYKGQTQLLASRGYAVLELAQRAGTKPAAVSPEDPLWIDLAVRDIIRGAQQVVADGIADPKRIFLTGNELPGALALMAAWQAPGQFAGVVTYGAVYDLEDWAHGRTADRGIWTGPLNERGSDYRSRLVGHDKMARARRSPFVFADEMRTPLLIIHGLRDPISPAADAKKFVRRARKGDVSVATHYGPRQGERFSGDAPVTELYNAVFEFLERNRPRSAE